MKKLIRLFRYIASRIIGSKRRKIRGEQNLLVFISSVMNNDMVVYRKAIKEHIEQIYAFDPWAFEFTSSSSEDVVEGFLRKVRESDFIIWLVRDITTSAVENEIRNAISTNKRLLIFILPNENKRDNRTENLLSDAKLFYKYCEVSNLEELLLAVDHSLIDEIIRSLRSEPGLNRNANLVELLNSSRARCITRWQSAGIPIEKASIFFEDKEMGKPREELINHLSQLKLAVLMGDFGSGKSLMAERLLQENIKNSIDDSSSPVPVFISSRDQFEDLAEYILLKAKGLGNPRIQGAFILIDGVDEVGISYASGVLNQARNIVKTWKNTSVIITSRNLYIFSNIEEKVEINDLNEDEILDLVNMICTNQFNKGLFFRVKASIRDAIKRPFFTILWAKYLDKHREGEIKTTGELINYFVEDIIQIDSENLRRANELLEELGIKVIENGGNFVPWREVCTNEELGLLLETRLISKEGQRIGFPLPIFTQWFAANGLVKGRIDIDGISMDPLRLENWLYPLIIIVSMFPHRIASKIIAPVVINNPGIASEVITEGIDISSYDENNKLPNALECGNRIHDTYMSWLSGIGELAKYIGPIVDEGSLQTIGVSTDDDRLNVAWYKGIKKIDQIVEISPRDCARKLGNSGWYVIKSNHIGSQSAWAWRWSLNDLKERLSKFIDRRIYVIRDGYLYREKIWEFALKVMRFGSLHEKPINLDDLEAKIVDYLESYKGKGHTIYHELNIHLRKLRNNNLTVLSPPWPTGDLRNNSGGWIWSSFSDMQVLKRAIAIYSAALEEYNNLINGLFVNFKSRMLIGTLIPVKMHGNIHFLDTVIEPFGREPVMSWYFEPLPLESRNEVDFCLSDADLIMVDTYDLLVINRKMRPKARNWISSFTHNGVLDIFNINPLTKIIYGWLESDLKRIKWL